MTTVLDTLGQEALTFTVSSEWAHFRRIDTTTAKQSYRIIPRTTVAGLIGAIVGCPRDSYYDAFQPENSAIAITPNNPITKHTMSKLELGTTDGEINSRGHIKSESTADSRQRNLTEYLTDVSYTIDVVLDHPLHDKLREKLVNDTAVYTPALGKSQCLATIEVPDKPTTTVTESDDSRVDSIAIADAISISGDSNVATERSPAFIEMSDSGRQPTGFLSYGFNPNGDTVPVRQADVRNIHDRTVMFI